MTFGSLFAGIGGFDLGFERAGLTCRWQVEIDPYCQRVLAKHWPNVARWDDVRTFAVDRFVERVDVICGGFPCQDISLAGKGAGIDGERSGLWSEYARIVRTLRPRYVVVENVAALLGRGLGRVLGDLADSGFDAEWSVLSACALGASHSRERLFLVAYATGESWHVVQNLISEKSDCEYRLPLESGRGGGSINSRRWVYEPSVRRVVDDVPDRVERLRGLGNAVVPQVAEWIGRRLMEAEHGCRLPG